MKSKLIFLIIKLEELIRRKKTLKELQDINKKTEYNMK